MILNAPAAFRFTAPACPDRHLKAADILGANIEGARPEDAGKILAEQIVSFMQDLHIPNGLRALGYQTSDIPRWWKARCPNTASPSSRPAPLGRMTWPKSSLNQWWPGS